ncbi:hypothetical protein IGI04_025406 [Brassica rapa subsp. trilocularis]|uniref:Uncharacterized protein n=1 Tax=Brassica rapa subsp. trilocularis TaxID=1813537 RepID=A0ABQ7KW57_BRACM|nr:hypothetical protein IGI04_025406 [Brassica rapa subsp. trilocularis]
MVRLDDDNVWCVLMAGFLIQEGTATTLLQGSIFVHRLNTFKHMLKEGAVYKLSRETLSSSFIKNMNEPSLGDDGEVHSTDNEALSIVSYRIEWNMRHALKPTYETLFEMLKYSSWRVAFFVHPMC